MSLPRSFVLERIGGRRRSVVEHGGALLCVCAYLGPMDGGVDLLGEDGLPAATIRGGAMAVRDYHARIGSGESLRVFGEAPLLVVHSSGRAPTEVVVAEEAGGRRTLTWRRDGGIDGVLRIVPANGSEPWTLDVPGWEEPLRALAALHAAERLLREIEA